MGKFDIGRNYGYSDGDPKTDHHVFAAALRYQHELAAAGIGHSSPGESTRVSPTQPQGTRMPGVAVEPVNAIKPANETPRQAATTYSMSLAR